MADGSADPRASDEQKQQKPATPDETVTAATTAQAAPVDENADDFAHKSPGANPEPVPIIDKKDAKSEAESALDSKAAVVHANEADSDDEKNDPQDRDALVDSVANTLQDTSIVDDARIGTVVVGAADSKPQSPSGSARTSKDNPLSPNASGFPRTSSKLPALSHPLQGGVTNSGLNAAGLSPAEAASAILLKDTDSARIYGARVVPGSGESEGTAFSPPMRNSGSPRSASSQRGAHVEITEMVSDGDSDAVEDHEERQRRLFRAAERRRMQREQVQQNNVSSEDIEVMRSGLSNAREFTGTSELHILNGTFPDGLRGSLYLLGPGRFDIKYNVQRELEQATRMFTYDHIMDALPLLTKISFDPNAKSIVHRSRLIAKQAANRVQMEHGVTTKVPGALYLSDTNQTVLSRFIPKSTHHVSPEGECCSQDIQLFMPLQGSNQTIVCTNHVGALQNIDPIDLHPRATIDLKNINSAFKGALSCPHMQYDSNTREHFSVLQDVGFRSTTYTVISISEAQPEGYVVASFTAQASILHSFAITQDYVIVPVYPYNVPMGGMGYRWSDSLLETLSFNHGQPVFFYVISREYRRVQCVYRAPAFFALHQINAVQEMATDSVSIDMVTYNDDTILRRLRVSYLRKPGAAFSIPAGVVRRFQLNGITMEATRYVGARGSLSLIAPAHPLVLRSEPIELARINPMVAAQPYTYLYGLSHTERLRMQPNQQQSGATMYNCIVKLNINDASVPPQVWSRTHCYPSEPVFVPRSDKEDDGYVLSVFFDSMRITSCLLVLDAKSFKEVMIAQLPAAIPISFGHGKFAI
ncbi:hypothetical protein H4R20_004403 [Coemansia guatemalensis]|uniref:Uncharacterized protein n=1 Tax=Coemansia guatemalensis TaxID=2761395 RepID=A0A9W8LRR9_9FUNG|nr:hypothetical protein H4R20_004403 [Coemansia guatemalensis]